MSVSCARSCSPPVKSPIVAPVETRIEPSATAPSLGNLHSPSLSEGVRLVAFVSLSNLPEGVFSSQVYLYEVASRKMQPVGEMSCWPVLTPDGRFLAYEIVGRSDQVFVHDVSRGQSEIVSVSSAGDPA